MNRISIMKTALHTLIAASLLGLAFLASGRLVDAADLAVLLFSAGLVTWTISQYRRVPRALTLPSSGAVRLPVGPATPAAARGAVRLAA